LNGLGGGNGLNSIGSGTSNEPFGSGEFGNRSRSLQSNGDYRPLNDLSSDEIQRLENQLVDQGRISDSDRSELLERKAATIYVSTIRRNNQIIVRTGDLRSMEQIELLIKQLDVPLGRKLES